MKSAIAFGLLLFVSGATPTPRARTYARMAPAPVTIPFELANHLVIVRASINKSRPLSFLLDTGASLAIVRSNIAQELKLSLSGSVNGRGAGPGSQTGSRVTHATWSLVGLERLAQPVSFALPLPELPFALGRDIDGIVGGEFIRQFVVELDYQAHVLRLHDPAAFAYSGPGETLPLEFNADGHPVVAATVVPSAGTRLEGRFLFDIGSSLALALHAPLVREHNLLALPSKTIRSMGAGGLGGRSDGRIGRVTTLQIGSFTLHNPITVFSQAAGGALASAELAGNIGAQIANRFRVFLDYRHRHLILEPAPTYSDPYDPAFSGLALRAEGATYRTFRVRDVLEDSPAAEAGLMIGDVITAIDGTAADALTMTTINEMLEKPIARQVVVQRGEQTIRVTLTPRPLI